MRVKFPAPRPPATVHTKLFIPSSENSLFFVAVNFGECALDIILSLYTTWNSIPRTPTATRRRGGRKTIALIKKYNKNEYKNDGPRLLFTRAKSLICSRPSIVGNSEDRAENSINWRFRSSARVFDLSAEKINNSNHQTEINDRLLLFNLLSIYYFSYIDPSFIIYCFFFLYS